MINREGYYVGEVDRECTNCGTLFPKTSRTVTLCNVCNSSRVKGQPPERKMWARARSLAKDFGYEFNITVSDINIPKVCPVLGIELVTHSGKSGGKDNSPALDRIDNTQGYVVGNVQVISQLANVMKSSANKEQLLMFAKWVMKTYPEESNKLL